MPLYSVTLSNDEIIKIVNKKYQNVLLLACSGCMNESLAFDLDLSITRSNNGTTFFPAIEYECNRIAHLLKNNNINVDKFVIPAGTNSRCIINLDEPLCSLPIDPKYDAILVLSCRAGLQDILQRTDIPCYCISRQIGMINYDYTEDSFERRIVKGTISKF